MGLDLPSAAKQLGIGESTLRVWRGKGCPVEKDGTFDVEKVRAWAQARPPKRNGPAKLTTDDPGQRAHPEERRWGVEYRRAKALHAQLELELKRKSLTPTEDVERMFVQRVTEVRQALLTLPAKMARRLANQPAQIVEAVLDDEVRGILEAFAREPDFAERRRPRRQGAAT